MSIHFQYYKNGSLALTSLFEEPVLQFLPLPHQLHYQHRPSRAQPAPTKAVVQTPARAIRMGATESPAQMGTRESVRRALIKDVTAPRPAVQPSRATRTAAQAKTCPWSMEPFSLESAWQVITGDAIVHPFAV
jgi:hypothetical protein